MRDIAHEKTMSLVALHDTDQRHGVPPLLQLCPAMVLVHLKQPHYYNWQWAHLFITYSVQGNFSRLLQMVVNFYAKRKRDSVQPTSNWHVQVTGWVIIWSLEIKYGVLVLCVSDSTVTREKYKFSAKHFSRRMTKHPDRLLRNHLFQFNISHTTAGHVGRP